MIENVIELKNLSFKYSEDKVNAIDGINCTVDKGKVIFIAGDSGSGKSTLLNIINGIIPEVIEGDLNGKVYINKAENLKIYERSLILGNVFQNPRSQFFTTNTTSELVFAMENYGKSYEEMKERLIRIVDEFKIEKLLDRDIFSISSGERQFLALLTVLIMNPNVIIFDEPSANLDYGNAMRLKRQIEELRESGKTVVVADHRCFYLRGIIDKVLLIEDKTVIEFGSEEEFFNCAYGKRVFDLFTHKYKERKIVKSEIETVKLQDVYYKNILENINVSFNKNETTVIVGTNGAGKTTLAKLISKIEKADRGKIEIENRALYIMQDADFQLFGATCLKELEITSKNEAENMEILRLLNLYDVAEKHPQSLSGGQKQRLQMAISLVSKNDVIILDEPTSGLDKNSMNRVIELIEKLKQNRTLIIISHDYEFIRKSADRVVYLKDKKIEEDFYLEHENVERLNNIYKQMEEYYE
ncbi:ABC transporter ATP-binding protein [Peptoniphilus sp. oral taxon 386]|uniref:ABC transporter ATP-binding protein n=1 Tax=Peptoniphilus sp. oral taxon 386 TaxID=652713 RepID=UPI0001DA9A7D|nr:ABC transporter ATP-binding protein [Peptoniphilus sp. oral taxon 386]EFI41943.1 ABC transporter, ATP-binding protein [Peptoniphilus sp. oral taxon 386 str. F0131]